MDTQDNVFARSEADRWFQRNRGALQHFDPGHDLPLKLLRLYDLRPDSVIEIGAANGFRVAEISRNCGARAVAVDLSQQAIADGQIRYPFVTFLCGAASAVPVHETFDLIILNFVFHWIDRALLLRSVAEVDRLVRDNGFVLIGDFFPVNRLQVPYHHLQDGKVTTFKQNYAEVFSASGIYHPVGMMTAHHASKAADPHASENERIGAWLLRKQLKSHYIQYRLDGRPK